MRGPSRLDLSLQSLDLDDLLKYPQNSYLKNASKIKKFILINIDYCTISHWVAVTDIASMILVKAFLMNLKK